MRKYLIVLISLAVSVSLGAQDAESYKQRIANAEELCDLDAAVQAYTEWLDNYEASGSAPQDKPTLLIEYSLYLSYAGRYSDGIKAAINGIELAEEYTDQDLVVARGFMQLGLIYFFMEQYDLALTHYERAEELADELDNDLGLSIAKNNIGNIYQKQSDYETAVEYYEESLKIQQHVNDSATICNTIFNIGSCYEELGESDKAVEYFQESLRIAECIHESEIESLSLIHLGILTENINQIRRSIDIVERSGHRQVLLKAYEVYGKLKAEMGDYAHAYELSCKAKMLTDSLFKAEAQERINEFSAKYELKEKEAENKVQRVIFITATLVCLIIIAWLFLLARMRSRSNARLRDLNMRKDKFVSIMSHDIKNPLVSQKSVLEMVVQNFDQVPSKELRNVCDDLLSSSRSLLDLLYNLLSWSKLESKAIRYNPVTLDVIVILREVRDTLQLLLKQKNITLHVDAPEHVLAYGDYNILSTVLRNVLSNAIKYSYCDGLIEIRIADNGLDHWEITVQDHGVGMTDVVKESLFKLTSVKSQLGTRGETGSGLGLIITKEMVEMNGGSIAVESEVCKGTIFTFTVKKHGSN